jgi:hypothetical protein
MDTDFHCNSPHLDKLQANRSLHQLEQYARGIQATSTYGSKPTKLFLFADIAAHQITALSICLCESACLRLSLSFLLQVVLFLPTVAAAVVDSRAEGEEMVAGEEMVEGEEEEES